MVVVKTKKGISGHVLVIVITIIAGMIGLILLWVFLKNASTGGAEFAKEVAKSICESIKSAIGIFGLGMSC